MLVAKRHWLECQNRFAGLVHRLDVVLEARRGSGRAEVTCGIDKYRYASSHSCPINTSDKSGRLPGDAGGTLRADGDGAGFAGNAFVADIDIVNARGEVNTGLKANCDIAAAGGVVKEGIESLTNVVAAGGVAAERFKTAGRVVAARGVVTERSKTAGRVVAARGVATQYRSTAGRVVAAGCIAKER